MTSRKLDYALVYWLIMLSGNPVLTPNTEREAVVLAVSFVALLFYRNVFLKLAIDVRMLGFCATFFLIFLVQAFQFNFFPAASIAGFYIRLLLGLILFSVIPAGPEKYVRCMVWICVVSLAFFLVSETLRLAGGPPLRNFFEPLKFISGNPDVLHVFLYNFDGAGEPNRNSGPFWEPGAFSGYILVAILLLARYKPSLSRRRYICSLLVFGLALLSTKSTTGYLLLPLALVPHLHFNFNLRSRGYVPRMLGVAALVVLAPFVLGRVVEIDFLKKKIVEQYYDAVNKAPAWEINRFGNFLFDLQYIEKKPLVGWGINEKTRYALHGGVAFGGQGNDLSGAVRKFGLLGFGLYLSTLFFSFRRFYAGNARNVLVSMLVIMLVLNAEIFLNYPIFLGLIALRRA